MTGKPTVPPPEAPDDDPGYTALSKFGERQMRTGYRPPPPPPLPTRVNPYTADWAPKSLLDLSGWFNKRKQKPAPEVSNEALLRDAYTQATEIGIPAGLCWRMCQKTLDIFMTEYTPNNIVDGSIAAIYGVPVEIDNDVPLLMVYLEGDGVDVTIMCNTRMGDTRKGIK